jgi:antitoxin YefM
MPESLLRTKVVSCCEARNNLKSGLDRVVEDADYPIITRRDAEDAVVMSLELFDSLLETVHLLKSPANAAHLERSIAQFKQRKVIKRNLLDDYSNPKWILNGSVWALPPPQGRSPCTPFLSRTGLL